MNEEARQQAAQVAPLPTVGRVVWFWPQQNPQPHEQPHAATVAYVHMHSPAMVNLAVVDHNGIHYSRTSVPLFHPDQVPADVQGRGGYATWMPYQVR